MTEAPDSVHQIEYRWHDRRDLSPIASTMSADSLRGWDAWIRTWVRHPHVEGLGESVCYQVQPNGRAALAWRYEDWQAAEREDGTRGRPLVSRVLAGQASQLTPEVAIGLCHTGLGEWAGPPPGRVTSDGDLAVVGVQALTRVARSQAAGLDLAAIAQRDCLLGIIAPALADPRTPIAVHLPDADVLKPPGKGLPGLLLWGLRRIVRPVLGTGGRGWSFSTFELPPGDVDPATMPDILFRQAQYTPRPVARPRTELKLRPFEPKPTDAAEEFVDLATWLLAEYQETGGDGLRQLVESLQGPDKSVQPRISRIYEELRSRQAPANPRGPVTPPVHRLPGREWPRRSEPSSQPMRVQPVVVEPWRAEPARAEPVAAEPVRAEPALAEPVLVEPVPVEPALPEPVESDLAEAPEPEVVESAGPIEDLPRQGRPVRYSGPELAASQPLLVDPVYQEWQESAGKHRAADSSQHPRERVKDEEFEATGSQHGPTQVRRLAVNDLLKRLPEAEDAKRFQDIVRDILNERSLPEFGERHLSRREVSKPEWYAQVSVKSHPTPVADLLAEIFEVIVIPDLDDPEVIRKVSEWAERAAPPMVGGLLAAAKQSGPESSRKMMDIVQHRLAFRWMTENHMAEFWYTVSAAPQAGEPDRPARFGFRRKN